MKDTYGIDCVTPLQGWRILFINTQGWHPGLSCYAPLGLNWYTLADLSLLYLDLLTTNTNKRYQL